MTRMQVMQLVHDERERQKSRWGDAPYPNNDIALRVLVEEVGEIAMALNDGESDERVREEIVQVAAVCFRWLEGKFPIRAERVREEGGGS